jgi:hypothetical protein
MGILTLVGLLAGIVSSLKNSAGQPLVGSTLGGLLNSAEGVLAAIINDVQANKATGPGSATSVSDDLATMQAVLTALSASKVLSAQTVSLITALSTAIAAAIAAEQAALKVTDPSLLTPIPEAE